MDILGTYQTRGIVSINGVTAPVIGRVCMDLTIIDITDIKSAEVGDEVVLFGDGNVSVDKVASLADTISYELLSIVEKGCGGYIYSLKIGVIVWYNFGLRGLYVKRF